VDSILFLPAEVLLEVVNDDHPLDITTNTVKVLDKLCRGPLVDMPVVVVEHRHSVLSVEPVGD